MNSIHIQLEHISKSFSKPILKDVTLDITNESYYAICGKSGAGKSTLMNILGLIEGFDGGEYFFNEEKISSFKDYSNLRINHIGFIFQSYNLIPTLNCKENILLPKLYSSGHQNEYDYLVEMLEIETLLNQKVGTLSGGEKQRVAIARALLLNPELIIADEPTGNLDEENKKIVLDLLKKEHDKGRAVVLITHDQEVAHKTEKIFKLENGCLYENKKIQTY